MPPPPSRKPCENFSRFAIDLSPQKLTPALSYATPVPLVGVTETCASESTPELASFSHASTFISYPKYPLTPTHLPSPSPTSPSLLPSSPIPTSPLLAAALPLSPASDHPLPPTILPVARCTYVEPLHRHDLGAMNVQCPSCAALHWLDERLSKSSMHAPHFGFCCYDGRVSLPSFELPPFALKTLFDAQTRQAKEFREHIRQYNAALAFTSLGAKVDESVTHGGGPYVFRLHGELCHRVGSLLPPAGHPPQYAQLYIHDPTYALQLRVQRNENVREDTMELLQRIISANHAYAEVYRHAYDILQEHGGGDEMSLRLCFDPTQDDRRRYNLPCADEIAIILAGDGEQPNAGRDLILRSRSGELQRIYDTHPAYATLHYVLFFPHGELGWHSNMCLRDSGDEHVTHRNTRLTQTRFYAYQFQVRPTEYSTLIRGGRLFQQYVVDSWASAEQNRLNYLRLNQDKIRASLYSGLEDAVATVDDSAVGEHVDLNALGRRVILPSSYNGSARYMYQLFQDSLAIGREFRKVDIFLTMTCNPSWPEITRELLPGQTPADRPDLVSRVFQLKKMALLKDILDEHVLGDVAAYVYTIEFQKRGLPHMHLLVFFAEPYKIRNADDVDSFVCASLPDPVVEPLLYHTVTHYMIHGPCGAANPTSPCMQDGQCTKSYPKAFRERTSLDDDGYPLYRRPNDGKTATVRDVEVDNRWIVPYCPWLCAKYDCHINVEVCVSFASLKYIHKYIYKGSDRTTVEIDHQDEIKLYIDARYVSAMEGIWRTFHFDLHDRSPAVVRLQVHLPGQHMVRFDPDESLDTIIARAAGEQTTLTAFFKANASTSPLSNLARQSTYQDFPKHFVWSATDRRWKVRKQGSAIGRLYFVPPTSGELFYLRTLLTVVKGPTSFESLRTVNGHLHDTFREACLARGLLDDDGEWRLCFTEAGQMQTGSRLRRLFITVVVFCNVSDAAALWREFQLNICDDLAPHVAALLQCNVHHVDEADRYDYGLFLIGQELSDMGYTLTQFALPQPIRDWTRLAENSLIAEQVHYNADELRRTADEEEQRLNREQRDAYDRIVKSVVDEAGGLFFLNGAGGTGKTTVYKTLCNRLRGQERIVLCVASSGIAALLLPGGRTAHSTFKIPVEGLTADSICAINKESRLGQLLRVVELIVWDEITQQHKHAFEAVDRTFRDIRDSTAPFGGVTLVFGGDFQQILPVVPRGSREDIVDATIQTSPLWQHVDILRLSENMRLQRGEGTEEFAAWLLDVGHGRINTPDGRVQLPPSMRSEDLQALIDFIYPDVSTSPPPPPDYFLNRIILSPLNIAVDGINDRVLSHMTGTERCYTSADTVLQANGQPDLNAGIPAEFLRTIQYSGLPPGELKVKVGCPLILLRNLAPMNGLCNGTRMVVLRASDRVLEVQIMGGTHDGEIQFIPRITINPSSSQGNFSFAMSRRQFPVRLAFAMSINKAQGQSVNWVGIDLRTPVFTHGQLYVALSRATSSERIRVLFPDDQNHTYTPNIVYPEVLVD